MESKNIKVIDEHGIDRKASIICALDVDGSDYVVYWIERDNENDNIFISKILKNIDGTASMINIDDAGEKEKMSELVKELVKYSIDNGENKLSSKSVTLPGGKVVNVSSVLFNKEQNINVQKTYITTVKKAVTKVSEEYYDVPVDVKKEEPKDDSIFETVEEVIPNTPPVAPIEPTPVVLPEIPEVETPVVEPVTPAVELPADINPTIEPQLGSWEEPKTPETPVNNTVPEATIPEPNIEVTEPKPVAVTPTLEPKEEKTEVAPIFDLNAAQPAVTPEPTVAVPATPVAPASTPSPLVFDASSESNLNQALGETSNEANIPVQNIEPVREFGVDANAQPQDATSPSTPPAATGNKGFANNKFFMVIAIVFFMASCVFLGYEVFNYFQIVK